MRAESTHLLQRLSERHHHRTQDQSQEDQRLREHSRPVRQHGRGVRGRRAF
jgi:hypothetical protein